MKKKYFLLVLLFIGLTFITSQSVQAQNNTLQLNGLNQYVAADGVSTTLVVAATLTTMKLVLYLI